MIALHLWPGLVLLVVYAAAAQVLMAVGLPPMLGLYVAAACVAALELAFLLSQGRRLRGRWTLAGVVAYRAPLPAWQYLVLVPALLVWSVVVAALVYSLLEVQVREALVAWLPAWMAPPSLAGISAAAVWAICAVDVVVRALAAPAIEELYFRGYLLPRMDELKAWAPAVHTVLFSLQHFVEPWGNLQRIIAMLPMAYSVRWKRNVYLSIAWHCALNLLSSLALLGTSSAVR